MCLLHIMILYLGTCVGNWLCMYQCTHLPRSLCAFLCVVEGLGRAWGLKGGPLEPPVVLGRSCRRWWNPG